MISGNDKIYFMLPYGHNQTIYYSWAEAIRQLKFLNPHCVNEYGYVFVEVYWDRDYLLPRESRPRIKLAVKHKELQHVYPSSWPVE